MQSVGTYSHGAIFFQEPVSGGRQFMSAIGSTELIILVLLAIGICLFIVWVMMLVEALKTPTTSWDAAGQNQLLYVIGMFVVGFVGTLLYILIARPALRAVTNPD